MALSQTEILTVAGVLVLLFAVILTNNFRAAKATRALKAAQAGADAAPTNKPWLGRYLQHEGDIVGQVVAVEGERVIVRKGTINLAIAKSQVREQGADLGVVGTFDLAAAERDGVGWKAP
ncbi:MAG: DUF5749 family beta-barrel protein [Candidatus Thermoplasmatota archaeon]